MNTIEWLKKLSTHTAKAPTFPISLMREGQLFTYATDTHVLAVCRGNPIFPLTDEEKKNAFIPKVVETAWSFLSAPATPAGRIDVGMLKEFIGEPSWEGDRSQPTDYLVIGGAYFGKDVIGRALAAWPTVLASLFVTPADLEGEKGFILTISDDVDTRVLCASFFKVTNRQKQVELPNGVFL